MSARLLSGVQPTGGLHIGNYLGALQQWREMQHSVPSLFSIVDLHALTVGQNPAVLKQASLKTAATIIACGIDPKQSILFVQSSNTDIVRLNWLLSCVARIGWLNRMTQFKDKAGKDREHASVGLYVYPVLMAADILSFRATHVPVGHDQKQHLEFTRDVALKFNQDYGGEGFFPLPEPYILERSSRVMSLRDGNKKMSKSEASDAGRINLHDGPDTIVKKVKRAKTDLFPLPANEQNLNERPEAKNLLTLYATFAGWSLPSTLSYFEGKGFSELKAELADVIVSHLTPIRERMIYLEQYPDDLNKILQDGANRSREISQHIVNDAYKAMGLFLKDSH